MAIRKKAPGRGDKKTAKKKGGGNLKTKKPPAIKRRDHKPEAPASIGSDERITEAIWFAWSYRRRGYTYETISQLAFDEKGLNLERPPSLATIHEWIVKGRGILNEMTKDEAEAEREVMKAWVGQIVERFLPIAMSKKIFAERERIVDGEKIPIIDENAFAEQNKAALTVLKAVAQLAVLYGFEKPQAQISMNLTKLQLNIVQQMNAEPRQTREIRLSGVSQEGDSSGGVVEVLELTTGIEGL